MDRRASTPIEVFIAALKRLDPDWPITPRGDQYSTRCPVHGGDDEDSMSFTEGDDGRLLVTCHSRNCGYEQIVKSVGLRPSDGFPCQGRTRTGPGPKKEKTACLGEYAASDGSSSPCETLEIDPKTGLPVGEGETKVYEYTDEDGNVLSAVFVTPVLDASGRQVDKQVFQRRRIGDRSSFSLKAGWFVPSGSIEMEFVANKTEPRPSDDAVLMSEPAGRVLYRLPEVIEAVELGYPIFVVEGEKDVETLRNLGLDATTNPGGAGKWRKEHTEVLAGADLVVIIPDNDEPGRKHAQDAAESLNGKVKDLVILNLPGLGEKEDISDWVAHGGTSKELGDLVAVAPPFEPPEESVLKILDHAPKEMRRPLVLIDETAYLATIAHVGSDTEDKTATVLLSSSGEVYCDEPLPGSLPLCEVGFELRLPSDVRSELLLSAGGLRRAIAGEVPSPEAVFSRIVEAVQLFFDFSRSLAGEATVAKIVALVIMQTYFLDAFSRIGYTWISGGPGSGKSKLLSFITRLAYLGEFLVASSSYASLRDIAEAGSTIGIDDYDPCRGGDFDVNLRSLLLTGISRDAKVSLKVKDGSGGWTTRKVDAFGFKMFTSTFAPDPVLASRSIMIPLVPSGDGDKTTRDPECDREWTHDPNRLRDDLWVLGVRHLPLIRKIYGETFSEALKGRAFDSWRPILAVARWLEGIDPVVFNGLYDEIHEVAVAYQEDRRDLEQDHRQVIFIRALWDSSPRTGKESHPSGGTLWIDRPFQVSPQDIAKRMTVIAQETGILDPGSSAAFVNPREVGNLLSQYRFPHAPRKKTGRFRVVTPREVLSLADALGITLPEDPRDDDDTPGNDDAISTGPTPDSEEVSECHECRSQSEDRGTEVLRESSEFKKRNDRLGISRDRLRRSIKKQKTHHLFCNDTNDTNDTEEVADASNQHQNMGELPGVTRADLLGRAARFLTQGQEDE